MPTIFNIWIHTSNDVQSTMTVWIYVGIQQVVTYFDNSGMETCSTQPGHKGINHSKFAFFGQHMLEYPFSCQSTTIGCDQHATALLGIEAHCYSLYSDPAIASGKYLGYRFAEIPQSPQRKTLGLIDSTIFLWQGLIPITTWQQSKGVESRISTKRPPLCCAKIIAVPSIIHTTYL